MFVIVKVRFYSSLCPDFRGVCVFKVRKKCMNLVYIYIEPFADWRSLHSGAEAIHRLLGDPSPDPLRLLK